MTEELNQMNFEGPFQPKPLYDSMIHFIIILFSYVWNDTEILFTLAQLVNYK